MDRTEVLKIMAVLRGAYPQFYRDISRREAEDTVNLWAEMFSTDSYPEVAAAVKSLIEGDKRGFPPHIGAVKAKLLEVKRALPAGEFDELAWMRPYVLALADSVTEQEAEEIHTEGLLTWGEAREAGNSFERWAQEYWNRFPVSRSTRTEAKT